jgi:hypothetical protein
MRTRHLALVIVFLALAAAPAAAQTFPADAAWAALPCRGGPMSDGWADESNATGVRDIVGSETAPAGLRAADATYFYLRLRLDEDPAPGGDVHPFAWGIELDVDGDVTSYEALLVMNGKVNPAEIELYRNSSTTLPNDPNDPADDPPIATYPFSTSGATVVAAGSSYGGDPDYFLELAIPWTDLALVGVTPTTPIVAWAASSSTATSLNGDFACHDPATGPPELSVIAPDPTVLDPGVDSDGDGWPDADEVARGTDPADASRFPLYRGGGGCAAGEGALLALLGAFAALASRRAVRAIRAR